MDSDADDDLASRRLWLAIAEFRGQFTLMLRNRRTSRREQHA
ncbi:hypothetical protein BDD21_2404 [Thiocapsa rosea]|uniref:Uncharacterized protein n=1 Tax=Thiocapsa rosea TaxID=69360 RepID=A0A495V6G6_9GAMM|nr:hypothetical protein BDD21_2404 [Thiocapsa rosea]